MSLVPAAELRELYGASARASVSALACDVVLIAATIAGAVWISHPLTTVAAIILVGARQHALLVLMHEAAHCNLFANRRLNDVVGELLAATMFVSMASYRAEHLAHHRHLNSARDPDWIRTHDPTQRRAPDWRFPMPASRIAWLLVRDLLGLDSVQQLVDVWRYARAGRAAGSDDDAAPPSVVPGWARLLGYAVLAAVLTIVGGWWVFLLYWMVPALTWLKMALRLRYMAEHFAIPGAADGDGTRTTLAPGWQRLLIAPHGIAYHVEHHLYPGVPCNRLPELHARVSAHGGFVGDQHLSKGGFGAVLRELAQTSKSA